VPKLFQMLDEVPGPGDVDDVTNTTTTTTTQAPPWQGPAIPIDIGIVVAAVVGIILALVIGYFVYRYLKRDIQKILGYLNFNIHTLLDKTKQDDLSAYNRKYVVLALVLVIGIVLSTILPILLTPDPIFQGVFVCFGILITISGTGNYSQHLDSQESKRNEGAVFMPAEIVVPGLGTFGRMLKRVTIEGEVKLKKDQLEQMIDGFIERVKKGNEGKTSNDPGHIKLPGDVKAKMLEAYKKNYTYRATVMETFHFLFVLRHKWVECVHPKEVKVFDETRPVKVKRAPMTIVYINEEKQLFNALDKDGDPAINEIATGVFLSIVDRKMVEDALLDGRFEAPNAMDATLSSMLFLYTMHTRTGEWINRKLREYKKEKRDHEKTKKKKSNEHQKQFNELADAHSTLFGRAVSQALTSKVFWFSLGLLIMFLIHLILVN